MRFKIVAVTLLLALAGVAAPASAGRWHGSGRFGWGFGWGWGWPWWWWGGPAYYQPVAVGVAPNELAAVKTDVEPEQARVFLDGELIGVADDFDGTPSYLFLKPGHYNLEFRLGGYKTETMEINAQPGQLYPVDFKLARIPGEKATPWYDRPKGLPVARVFGPKPGNEAPAPKPAPDASLRPEFQPPPPPDRARRTPARGAALELKVTPPNAAVYIDGELVGTGAELGRLERGVAVVPGHHKVEAVAPGMTSRTVEVDVKEGERQQVVVELEGGLDKSS